eukprot:gb/GECH01004665.1/.p1 GENE.gb/GECH01004665.1/~~gb/GECH01004665.1/.p1  ORF type:complete len:366 (+),score=93.40 gb/GECH01004665.1/:1-1098(+)
MIGDQSAHWAFQDSAECVRQLLQVINVESELSAAYHERLCHIIEKNESNAVFIMILLSTAPQIIVPYDCLAEITEKCILNYFSFPHSKWQHLTPYIMLPEFQRELFLETCQIHGYTFVQFAFILQQMNTPDSQDIAIRKNMLDLISNSKGGYGVVLVLDALIRITIEDPTKESGKAIIDLIRILQDKCGVNVKSSTQRFNKLLSLTKRKDDTWSAPLRLLSLFLIAVLCKSVATDGTLKLFVSPSSPQAKRKQPQTQFPPDWKPIPHSSNLVEMCVSKAQTALRKDKYQHMRGFIELSIKSLSSHSGGGFACCVTGAQEVITRFADSVDVGVGRAFHLISSEPDQQDAMGGTNHQHTDPHSGINQ